MIRYLREYPFPLWMLGIFFGVYVLLEPIVIQTFFFWLEARNLPGDVFRYQMNDMLSSYSTHYHETSVIHRIFILMAAGFYALGKAFWFHPVFDELYGDALNRLPWTLGKPLPKGPLRIHWIDLLVIGFLALLAARIDVATPVYTVALFVGGYAVLLAVPAMATGPALLAWVTLALVVALVITAIALDEYALTPLLLLPVAALVLFAADRVAVGAMKRFPWSSLGILGRYREVVADAGAGGSIGWPLMYLRPTPAKSFATVDKFVAILFVSMICLVLALTYTPTWPYFMALFIMTLLRLARLPGALTAPISLAGRLKSRRLLVASYDYCLLAPLAAWLVFGTGLVLVAIADPAGKAYYHAVIFILGGWLLVFLPPPLREWRATGTYRLRKPTSNLNEMSQI